MSKIPAPILQFVLKAVLNNVGGLAKTPLEQIPHMDVVAKAYVEGQSLEVIFGLYFQATGTVKDDEIAGKVAEVMKFIDEQVPVILKKISEESFKEVLGELLGKLSIPDFNNDESDDVKVITVINRIMSALAAE